MEPFALAAAVAAVAGASVVKQYRAKPDLTGIAGVVQFTLRQLTRSFVQAYTSKVPATTKTYGNDIQKILAFNQAQNRPVDNEQVYEWVALLGSQLQSISVKISVVCTTDFENSKQIRYALINSLHKKICQHVKIPKHTRMSLAITVEEAINMLFAAIHKRVKRMYTRRKWKNVWRTIFKQAPTPASVAEPTPVEEEVRIQEVVKLLNKDSPPDHRP